MRISAGLLGVVCGGRGKERERKGKERKGKGEGSVEGRTDIANTQTADVREERSERNKRGHEEENDEGRGPGWYSIVAHAGSAVSLSSQGRSPSGDEREIGVCFELFDSFCAEEDEDPYTAGILESCTGAGVRWVVPRAHDGCIAPE